MIVCAACGHENPSGSRFCNGCGASLAEASTPAREERKVVTVVFADLVGSTARAERLDPEDVRAILAPYHARLRHELERHGGTVEKFIGDAVVAVFGAPVAHEDDPERAVRAALAVQEAIAELNEADPGLDLEVRIGVNTGESLVNLTARPERGEAMVSGDVMNTAARIQSAAPPGGIVVGEQTSRATGRVIELVEHPAISAKGKAEPVPVWRVVGQRASFGLEDDLVGRAPLVGREREVSLLTDALERVRRDERPQLVTLVGVPGIGKSRLVRELRALVDADAELITWRRGRSLPYGEGVAYWALGEIVKAEAGVLESDDASTAGEKLRLVVQDLLSDPSESPWVERHLGGLVGLVGSEARPARGEAFAAWRRFLEALAERRPTVLVFEDLHWADDDLLDFVDQLADRLDAVPLLLVCTARPELLSRRPGWGGGKLNAVTLSLAPLTDDETARLLRELLDRSLLDAETQTAIVRRAGGVPLFTEELVRMLGSGDGDVEIPETLQGIVAARIDGLDPAEKALLQDAAVLGKVFWTDALAELSGLDAGPLDESLHALERREFVRRERRSAVEGARQYVFVHALVRDAAYAQIPRAARSAKHRATAEWIMQLSSDRAEDRSETLAHHLESAIAFGQAAGSEIDDLRPAAVAALRDAGDRAWALNSMVRAERFYQRALDASPEADPELLFLHGRARMWAEGVGGDPVAELETAIDGFERAGRLDRAALAAITLNRYLWNTRRPRPELLARAIELVGPEPTAARCEVLANAASTLAIWGRAEEGLPLGEEAVAIARALGDRAAEAQALNSLGVAQDGVGRRADGIASTRRALELALGAGASDGPRCYVNVASLEFDEGLLEESHRHLEEGYALASRFESTSYTDWLGRELPGSSFHLGRWDEALVAIRACLARSAERDEPHLLDVLLLPVEAAIVLHRDGVLLDGKLEDAVERARAVGDPQTLEPALAESALVLALAGRNEAAWELVEELVAVATTAQGYYSMLPAVLAWTAVSDRPFPPHVYRDVDSLWRRAAMLVGTGDLPAAAEVLGGMNARTHEAHTRMLAAERLATSDPPEALRQLERAEAFFRSVGATARLAQLEGLAAMLRPAAS